MTWALASADPPGPVAVKVYVTESVGVTRCEPSADTLPTPGERLSEVAFVEDQVNVTESPFWIVLGEAWRFTVGFAGGGATGGGGGGGATGAGFLQAALRARIASNEPNKILECVRFRISSSSSFDNLRELPSFVQLRS